jgi:predicted LPLAT superfamily acyltransferase
MSINACVIIPVYRHCDTVREVLKKIEPLGLPVILVDDGNSPADAALLRESARETGATLCVHATNQGKGAALMSGIRRAYDAGFSHAVQIDADGQHDAGEMSKFLAAAEQHPEALILGTPVFDASAPRARVWGRKLTTWMIHAETFGTAVHDGLFGYRVYPLPAVCRVPDTAALHPRMGFDVEIVVRLVWAGLKVVNIPTPVIYPAGGISNFRYLEDNRALIWLHIRLLFGGLLRAPKLLVRGFCRPQDRWYEKKERGNRFVLKLVMLAYRLGGRPFLEFLLYPVTLYFYVADRNARRASNDYWSRLHRFLPGKMPRPSQKLVYRHIHRFGRKIITSLQAWCGDFSPEVIQWEGEEVVFDLLDRKQGAFVLSAHVGCLEVCRATHHHRKGLKIVPLMYLENARTFRDFLEEVNPKSSMEIIPISRFHAGVALDIQERIKRGEFVAVLADRATPGAPERTVEIPFLGNPAPLPEGPFALAMALDCPVLTFFCFYDETLRRYRAVWQELAVVRPEGRTARRAETRKLAAAFAERLQEVCVQSPSQWFNFFQFWG